MTDRLTGRSGPVEDAVVIRCAVAKKLGSGGAADRFPRKTAASGRRDGIERGIRGVADPGFGPRLRRARRIEAVTCPSEDR